MIQIEVRLTGVETLKQKAVNDALKAAFFAVGRRWRRRYLPKHFTHEGARLYRYTPRDGEKGRGRFKGSYTWRKIQVFKHSRPLELTGEGKRQALYRENIRATRFEVVVRLPRKFNLRPKSGPVNMAEEIRTVSPGELEALSRFYAEQLERELLRRGARTPGVTLAPISLPAAA